MANAPNDLRAYIELIAGLPRPTDEQRDNFVNFVAGAHSWYKHLSILPPGTDFCFFLNPNSGRTRIHTPSGETGFVDRTEDDEIKFHYTWMTTANYRQKFGHWDYYCGRSPRFLVLQAAAQHDYVANPQMLNEQGEWICLPDQLLYVGTCQLTGLVHKHQEEGLQARMFAQTDAMYQQYARDNPDDAEVVRYRSLRDAFGAFTERDDSRESWRELSKSLWELQKTERPILLKRMRDAMDQFLNRVETHLSW